MNAIIKDNEGKRKLSVSFVFVSIFIFNIKLNRALIHDIIQCLCLIPNINIKVDHKDNYITH